jgi:hypothetical protein
MWPIGNLGLLDEADLRSRGLRIPLDAIWGPDGGGLGGAVVNLGGCTASFVSADGLIVTNHHCAFGAISRNSTDENNLIENGFVAATRADELPGKGMTATVPLRFTDVTDRVTADLPVDELERIRAVERRESEIVAECEAVPNRRCETARFNDGVPYLPLPAGAPTGVRRFVLVEAIELRDVRLVAAPPRSVGEFGGEVDNWHWPRHTGDYSILRAYVAPDGTPAEYAGENVPYRPERFLPVSADGIGPADLVMVMGYPYATERYQTAAEIAEAQEWYYPLRLELFGAWIDQMEDASSASEQAAILIAPMLKSIHNARSHARGLLAALDRSGLLERRRSEERAFRAWAAGDPARARAVEALDGIAAVLGEREASRDRDLLLRFMPRGSQALGFAWTIVKWAIERPKADLDREPGFQDRDEETVRRSFRSAADSFEPEADRRNLALFLHRAAALPEGRRSAALDDLLGPDRSDAAIEALTRRLYAGTALGDVETRLAMLGRPIEALRASEDPLIRFVLGLAEEFDGRIERAKRFDERLADLRPRYVAGLAAFRGRSLYPDANATLRLTVGGVRGYAPADGAVYTPFTTLAGIVEKETGEEPFASPANVLGAIRRGDRGRWEDPRLGDVPVCFLADVDTTGGNSGSPAIDGSGRLVGLLFDGVWEDLSGDYTYNPVTSRSILVDVRYILWHLDRVLGAAHLLREMGIE